MTTEEAWAYYLKNKGNFWVMRSMRWTIEALTGQVAIALPVTYAGAITLFAFTVDDNQAEQRFIACMETLQKEWE